MIQPKLLIDIEDIDSWPKEFIELLKKNKDMVVDYHQRREAISLICQEDVMARINPPPNEYAATYKQLVKQLENFLSAVNFMLFHCTRLTKYEAQNIKNNGLMILTSELVYTRIEQAFEQELLSFNEREYLRSSTNINDNLSDKRGNRTGMLWFCSSKSILLDGCGLHRLFRSWGGEAMYVGHEEDPRISDRLRQIGQPCIIKCSVPTSTMNHYGSYLSEHLISFFISNKIKYPEPGYQFDAHIKRNLFAHEIKEVISIKDPEFETLTNYKNWDYPIQ